MEIDLALALLANRMRSTSAAFTTATQFTQTWCSLGNLRWVA